MHGILALQGDFALHSAFLTRLNAAHLLVRSPKDLEQVNSLIIPGGESTTILLLIKAVGMLPMLKKRLQQNMPVFGTCAGCIILAKTVQGLPETGFESMNITVKRNAYGRQKSSFEALLDVPILGKEAFPVWFIRAPVISNVAPSVECLAFHNSTPVLVREKNLLAATFHSELGDDTRLHRYFLDSCVAAQQV